MVIKAQSIRTSILFSSIQGTSFQIHAFHSLFRQGSLKILPVSLRQALTKKALLLQEGFELFHNVFCILYIAHNIIHAHRTGMLGMAPLVFVAMDEAQKDNGNP